MRAIFTNLGLVAYGVFTPYAGNNPGAFCRDAQREQSLVELGQQTLSPEDRANGRLWLPPKTAAQSSK